MKLIVATTVLEVQAANMQRIIDKINHRIITETSIDMTPEQEAYVSGLADAIEIIREEYNDSLKVGNIYYVLMPPKCNETYTKIIPMRLYRINKKSKWAYCFSDDINPSSKNPYPSLVLYSKESLKRRVFSTREEAEVMKDLAFIKT